ncbi:MAG TPA: type II and III secretion system protein family protein, partial [Alphaproteobacteria bacterium]|nr:type II and III secretion system protein family protein [Alphaproteobacteria bacterium]
VSRAPRGTIEASVGQGQIFTFDEPAETVLVADPSVADIEIVSARSAYVYGVSPGRTNIYALNAADQVIASAALRVTRDAAVAQDELQRTAGRPGATLGYIGERPVAAGTSGDLGDALRLDSLARGLAPEDITPLNLSGLPGSQQVNIRVRFAEVSRSDILRLGINWQALMDVGNFTFGLATGNFATGGAGSTLETFGAISGGYQSADVDVDLLLEAFQREGIVNVLAEPNLTAVSGRTASFLAGGEFPVPVPQDENVITIEFKQFGVSLAFTPTVLPGDRIAIRIQPEVSTLSPASGIAIEDFVIPGLTVRRADTSIELASGQTFAIAGLFQRNLTTDQDQLPLLGDLPVLGKLFQSTRYRRDETELVILITPYVVAPVAEPTLALPQQMTGGVITTGSQPVTGGLAGFMLN